MIKPYLEKYYIVTVIMDGRVSKFAISFRKGDKQAELLFKFRPQLEAAEKRTWQRITEKEYLRLARRHGAMFQVFDIINQ